MNSKRTACVALLCSLLLFSIRVFAAESGDSEAFVTYEDSAQTSRIEEHWPAVNPKGPFGPALTEEMEPNNTPATAQLIATSNALIQGNIFTTAENDYYKFTASAGDRVYVATMTAFSESVSANSQIFLYDTDGTTLLESDDDDGSIASGASTIAGKTLSSAGTYFLRVTSSGQVRPYRLFFRLQTGAAGAESEPNDDTSIAQPLPASGWISGFRNTPDPDTLAPDVDVYSIPLNAGDTVFASLDLDPTRNNTQWNGRLGIGVFAVTAFLSVDDGSAGSASNPLSEAVFMTVKDAGVYYLRVNSGTDASSGDYTLSVTVFPASGGSCTTYMSTDIPKTIPDGPGLVDSTLTIPGNPLIGSISVAVNLIHANLPELDVALISPEGNENSIFTDLGNGSGTINSIYDDSAAVPAAAFSPVMLQQGMVYSPEREYRLSWLKGEDAGGTWMLRLRDDTAVNGGTLSNWSITVCEADPEPSCGAGESKVTVFSTDFESGDSGFTHSGTADDWQRGTPSFAPITSCRSGANCWVTGLAGAYSASSNQDLISSSIDLTAYSSTAWVVWSQKHQIESALSDHASVDVRQPGGANPTRIWTWLDSTMTDSVGNPLNTLQESAGWAQHTADITSYAGENIELVFHLDSNASTQLKGLAIDDVAVYACFTCPAILLSPSTLPDANAGDSYDETITASGGIGSYSYSVTAGALPGGLSLNENTGQVTGTLNGGGTFTFTITASDDNGCTGSQEYTVHVICPDINVTPDTLEDGAVGVGYSQSVGSTGGAGTMSYSITNGTLPGQLSLNPATGEISGTPDTAESQNFTITATDENGCTGSRSYTIQIAGPDCLFCDDFESGGRDANWTYIKESWAESGGSLNGAPVGKMASTVAKPAFPGCINCYVESAISTTGGELGKIWILGWYVDKKNTMELLIRESADKILLKQRVNGSIVAKSKAIVPLSANATYVFRLAYDSAQFHVSLDGDEILSLIPVGNVPLGTIGYQVKNTTVSIGYITVN